MDDLTRFSWDLPEAEDPITGEEFSGLYFAFGCNMNERQMKSRCTSFEAVGIAQLQNFRLSFFDHNHFWDSGLENLVPAKGQTVWGVLYRLPLHDWDCLDAWQDAKVNGTGTYFHCPARVITNQGEEKVVIMYKKNIWGKEVLPSRQMVEFMAQGAKDHGIPEDYITRLLNRPSKEAAYPVPVKPRFDRALLAGLSCEDCCG